MKITWSHNGVGDSKDLLSNRRRGKEKEDEEKKNEKEGEEKESEEEGG